MSKPEVYTKVTAEVKDFNGNVRTVTIQQNAWDCDIDDFLRMFEGLLSGLTFHCPTDSLLYDPQPEDLTDEQVSTE